MIKANTKVRPNSTVQSHMIGICYFFNARLKTRFSFLRTFFNSAFGFQRAKCPKQRTADGRTTGRRQPARVRCTHFGRNVYAERSDGRGVAVRGRVRGTPPRAVGHRLGLHVVHGDAATVRDQSRRDRRRGHGRSEPAHCEVFGTSGANNVRGGNDVRTSRGNRTMRNAFVNVRAVASRYPFGMLATATRARDLVSGRLPSI